MKNTLLILIGLIISFSSYASSGGGGIGTPTSPAPACSGNQPPGNTCAQATPICDLNGYCGTTSSSYTANYWSQLNSAFCGSIENNSFLSFVASSTSISFNVWLTSSQDGVGIQIMVFSTAVPCTGAVTSYTCWNPGTATAGPALVSATGLTPGNTYYIMIDGNAGDVCDYIIGANSGISTPVDVTSSLTTICAGESVTLTATGGNGNYTWNADPALSATTGSVVTVTPPGPGTYTYTANSTVVGSLCPGSTTYSGDVTITVNPCGCYISASNSGDICSGGTIDLSASTVTGGSGYSWTGPNGFTSNQQNPSGVSPPTAPGTYSYTVSTTMNGINCSSTTDVIVSSATVDAGPDQSICAGEQVTLNGSLAMNYSWNNGVTNGVPFTPTTTMTYTVTGTSTGCTDTDEVTVTVNPIPSVSAGADLTACQGQNITLVGSPASPTTVYTWDNGVTNGVPFAATTTTTYTVTATGVGGCTSTDQILVNVIPSPTVSFTSNVSAGCSPLGVTFTNTSSATNNTFNWIFGNGTTSAGAGPVSSVYNNSGCYDVTLTSTTPEGCVGQLTIPSMICVYPNPIADFVAIPGTLSLLNSITTMDNQTIGATSYIWNFGDGSGTTTEVNPSHQFPNDVAGSYQITLYAISDYGCRDTARVNIVVEDEIIYYVPNAFTPDNDEYNPDFKPVFTAGFDPFDYKLLIFNRWGEVIFESNNAKVGWNGTYAGSKGVCQDGTYTWKIEFKTTRSDERKMLVGTVTLIR